MKKIIISMLTLVLGFTLFSATAFADTTLNSPGSMATVTVTNATTQPCNRGAVDGCWKSSTTASPGDMIAVHVYFKNTGHETARNVTLSVQPSRTGTNVSFSGGVAATNANRATGTATVTLTQEETITNMPQNGQYQADWYPNQYNSSPQPVNTDQLFGASGFPIGDVTPGTQGVLVVRFMVNGTATPTPTPGNSCVINNFSANPQSINLGSSSALTWNTSNCTSVSITQVGTNLGTSNNGYTVTPTNTTTYTLTAYPGGATATATVTVNTGNTGGGNNNYCTINSFYVDSNSINPGQTTLLHWNTTGSNTVNITGFGTQNYSSGSISISPYTSTNYTLSLNGNNCNGNTSQSVYVTVNAAQYNNNTAQPQAITTVASVFSGYAAQLNGIAVPNSSYGTTNAWFEYGSNPSLGNRTEYQNVAGTSGSFPYSANISGLAPGRTYYYRAAVQNQGGTAYGSTIPFNTPSAGVYVPPTRVVYVQPTVNRVASTTVTRTGLVAQSQPSLFKLEVDSNADHMCVGGTVQYTVNYQNISTQDLQNTVLRITFPGELTYTSSSQGSYDVTDRTLTISLGDVQPGQQGSVTVSAQVNSQAAIGKLAVITATIVYTNPVSHAQEQAIAYSLITVSNDCPSVLGASVFGFGGFLPTTLLGWLLLILIILALVVLARSLYHKREEVKIINS
jgi:uncharacterized repeat protein (TIGR01451 family)